MSASSASGVPAPAPAPAPPAAPLRPSVFAIMRHSHAVLRGALADLHDALPPAAEGAFADVRGAAAAAPEAAGAMGAFEAEWSAYKRFQALHARMEDGVHDKRAKLVAGGLWAILDVQFDDLAAKSGFRNLHAQVEKLERRVADAVRARSAPRLRAAWDAYQAKDEQHLALEEKLAGPALRQLPARGVELRQEMQAHILPAVPESEMGFFIGYALAKLERHHPHDTHARAFVHALAAVASSEREWAAWQRHVCAALSAAMLQRVCAEIEISRWGEDAYPPGQGLEPRVAELMA